MLITFKSRADGDVIMFGEPAQQLLALMGKDPADPRGIITEVQMPAAIAALRTLVEQDRQTPTMPDDDIEDEDPEERRRRHEAVVLGRRAIPLIAMLERSLQAGTPVIWES